MRSIVKKILPVSFSFIMFFFQTSQASMLKLPETWFSFSKLEYILFNDIHGKYSDLFLNGKQRRPTQDVVEFYGQDSLGMTIRASVFTNPAKTEQTIRLVFALKSLQEIEFRWSIIGKELLDIKPVDLLKAVNPLEVLGGTAPSLPFTLKPNETFKEFRLFFQDHMDFGVQFFQTATGTNQEQIRLKMYGGNGQNQEILNGSELRSSNGSELSYLGPGKTVGIRGLYQKEPYEIFGNEFFWLGPNQVTRGEYQMQIDRDIMPLVLEIKKAFNEILEMLQFAAKGYEVRL